MSSVIITIPTMEMAPIQLNMALVLDNGLHYVGYWTCNPLHSGDTDWEMRTPQGKGTPF